MKHKAVALWNEASRNAMGIPFPATCLAVRKGHLKARTRGRPCSLHPSCHLRGFVQDAVAQRLPDRAERVGPLAQPPS
ncbi:MAG: hypothetical protein MZU79_01865 [Anaerotruncus sp.]|nr:hypothetical protein [Anaerotruncus sp.]